MLFSRHTYIDTYIDIITLSDSVYIFSFCFFMFVNIFVVLTVFVWLVLASFVLSASGVWELFANLCSSVVA